ncbi:TFIIB-type zinc ribbon-containing protein [Roseovarius sp. D22-M7]|uniref:TFIIB-type zinc ribbon-containing protein n=1 Tax=Roseovarius sp. D22-M7 TaxID=3127116 RepID=UPI0030103F39
MQCPIDGTKLVLAERSGVEIDYCPECRGVWLDRGELDKIIDRSAPEAAPQRYDDRGGSHGKPRKKKESFLGELFDF